MPKYYVDLIKEVEGRFFPAGCKFKSVTERFWFDDLEAARDCQYYLWKTYGRKLGYLVGDVEECVNEACEDDD
jgi:hypothetical protein